jgi:hypothetical protein
MTASKPPPSAASVSELMQASAQLFAASLLKCLPICMIAVLCAQLPNIYWMASGHTLTFTTQHDANFDALSVAGMALEFWLLGAMMLRQHALAVGAPIALGAELSVALRRLPVVLLNVLLATLAVAAGLLLLIVPGVYLMVGYVALLLPVVLFDQPGPFSALVRSVQLLRPLWWKALAALVIASFLFVFGAIVLVAIVGMVAGIFAGNGPAFAAIETASAVAFGATFFVYLSALMLVLHSAASSSA